MKSILRVVCVILGAMYLVSCTSSRTAAEKEALVDVVLQDYAIPGGPGASAVVVKNGDVLYKKSFGMASIEEGRAITPETNFRLASLTKQFTAMAILILVNDSRLSLKDTITKFFPGFPAYGSGITVRHLLTHTSGIVDYETLLPDTQTVQVRDGDVLRLLSSVDTVYFKPGGEYRYSNSGYALLALIVEKASGQRFAEFLKTRIFNPLEMKGTVAFEEGISTVQNRAYGYSRTDTGWVFSDQSSTSAVLGDGGIYTSVNDMLLWDHSLAVGYLIPLYLLRSGWKPATLNDGSETQYGFGWVLNLSGRYPRHFHTGSTVGFRNIIVRYPVQNLTIIIFTNRNEGELIPLADEIAEYYLD